MVSIRPPDQHQQTHLGIGLYLAKLIAAFHQAELIALNNADQSGVCVRLILPILKAD
jgi:signal transduction histidine kinase